MAKLKLDHEIGVPAAYVDLVDERRDADSAEQHVVSLTTLGFKPRELIFDLNEDGEVIGVEILG